MVNTPNKYRFSAVALGVVLPALAYGFLRIMEESDGTWPRLPLIIGVGIGIVVLATYISLKFKTPLTIFFVSFLISFCAFMYAEVVLYSF